MNEFSIDTVINGILDYSSGAQVSFWENYVTEGEVLSTNHYGVSTYKMRVPDSEQFVVVKPKDTVSPNKNDPKKTAIFQELTAHYGVPTVQEVTVERNGKAIRISKYVHAIHLASSIVGNRDHLEGPDRKVVEEWFPEDIFDDYTTVQRHSQGDTWYTARINRLTLNVDKFRDWYKRDGNDKREKARASLKAIHEMVSDGLLFDLYGTLNFAFHDGKFVIIDVEPLQLSNVNYLKPSTVTYSEDLLNTLFSTVGLLQISYGDIVKNNYGQGRVLEVREEFNPLAASGRHWTLHTDVTNDEELQLYKQRLSEKKDSKKLKQ